MERGGRPVNEERRPGLHGPFTDLWRNACVIHRSDDMTHGLAADPPAAAALSGALLDSRQRWRDFVSLAADLAFEVDAEGRVAFVAPDPALGWRAARLLGRFASELLDSAGLDDPFLSDQPIRQRHVFVRRGDASVVPCTLSSVPIFDAAGRPAGTRGILRDISATEASGDGAAAALRRAAVMDDVLASIRREVLVPQMMRAAFETLMPALGADGIAVLEAGRQGARLSHHAGAPAAPVLAAGEMLLNAAQDEALTRIAPDGSGLLLVSCAPRTGERAILVAWRAPGSRDWDLDDRKLLSATGALVRMLLEQEASQREMLRQARSDPLTGLLNRRAFSTEWERRIERLDREERPATLLFIDIDAFKKLNDTFGHDVGDEVLRSTAALLEQTFRPTDLLARLGGDEFAVWLDGADIMAAAERADGMTRAAPHLLAQLGGDERIRLSLSIGLAQRLPHSTETIGQLIHRADQAMYTAKRTRPGSWCAAPDAP